MHGSLWDGGVIPEEESNKFTLDAQISLSPHSCALDFNANSHNNPGHIFPEEGNFVSRANHNKTHNEHYFSVKFLRLGY